MSSFWKKAGRKTWELRRGIRGAPAMKFAAQMAGAQAIKFLQNLITRGAPAIGKK